MTSGAVAPFRTCNRCVAVLLGVLVALVLVEGVVRLTGLAPPIATKRLLVRGDGRQLQYHCYPDNPSGAFQRVPDVGDGMGWLYYEMRAELKPLPIASLSESPWCVEYRREIEGVRGPRIRQFPTDGVVRLAGVGDSFALGEGVPFEDSLFAQMQQLAGDGVELVNVGRSGADFDLDVTVTEWAFDQLSSNAVVIVFVLNDVQLSDELKARHEAVFDLINVRAAELADGTARPWWARVSRVGHLFDQRARIAAIGERTIANYRDAYDPAHNGAALDALRAQFQALAAKSEQPVALVLYPLMFGLADYPFAGVHEQVAAMARDAGLPVLDLAPAFAGEDESDFWVHPVDHHPNSQAHGIAATALVEWLRVELPHFLSR